MEIQAAIIGVAIFVVSGIILLSISLFGIKEKSYEEALAEQRQQTNALLGQQTKSKPKENKKQKKAGKKVKEKHYTINDKVDSNEDSESTSVENGTPEHHNNAHLHVEFTEPQVILVDTSEEIKDIPKLSVKKRNKKEKVRPILIHNNKETILTQTVDSEPLPANHFEELHPKDEFELKHGHVKEEPGHVETPKDSPKLSGKDKKNKQAENKKEKEKFSKLQLQHQLEQIGILEAAELEVIPSPAPAAQPPINSANVGKEKKKKKSDFNTLQQLAVDKQGIVNMSTLESLVRKAELSRSEVQILIDVLLNKQQDAPAQLNEWTEGKADPVQKLKKQLAEKEKALADEQEALLGAQAKLREIRSEINAERSQLQHKIRGAEEALQNKLAEIQSLNGRILGQNQKINQLQAQLTDESVKTRKLIDEQNLVQAQFKQLEMKLTQQPDLEIVNIQLTKQIQDMNLMRTQLEMDLKALQEATRSLHDSKAQEEKNFHAQINHLQMELAQKDEYMRKMDSEKHEIEQIKNSFLKAENKLKEEIIYLNERCQQQAAEIEKLEKGTAQTLGSLQQHKDETDKFISQLKSDLERTTAEKEQIELAKMNGSIEANKAHGIELLNLQNELSSVKAQLEKFENLYMVEVDLKQKLTTQLEEQRQKNNDLREKNWKLVEALNSAESRLAKSNSKVSENDNDVLKLKQAEHDLNKFILRIFPDINISDNLPQNKWLEAAEEAVKEHVRTIQVQDKTHIAKLKEEINTYVSGIDAAEDMLCRLQSQIEAEELKWRNKLKEKEIEIEKLNELKLKIPLLEEQLKKEAESKVLVLEECQMLKARESSLKHPAVAMEQLHEEVDRLRQQLDLEKNKYIGLLNSQRECQIVNNKIPVSSTNGNATSGEQMLTSSSSAASSLTEVTLKPTNKKKKKKVKQ